MYLEGKNAVIEALRAGTALERILLARGLKPDKALAELNRLATRAHVPVQQLPRRELDELSERGAHQGVMALAAPFCYTPLDDIIATTRESDSALLVVLDHVTDPGNFGAVARSAEVVGAAGLVVASRRAAALTPAAHKAAAGAFAHLPVAEVVNITRAIEDLQAAGFWVAGASEHAETLAWDSALSGKIALVMGAEGTGLSRLVQDRCDFLVRLPQIGQVSSLNIAQAATTLMYEYLRQNQS